MVTLNTADAVLKSVYLDVICSQLNQKTNPFYAAIEKGSEEISGKEGILPLRYGINGGMGSATETGELPSSGGNNYLKLVCDLRNIYGTIEISDKALRAGKDSAGALVNVLNAEMEGLLDAAKFNFARMLWQDGSGTLATVGEEATTTVLPVDDTRNLMEGMIVDVVTSRSVTASGARIKYVDRGAKKVTLEKPLSGAPTSGSVLTLQQSYNAEIYGIPYLFSDSILKLYNFTRSDVKYLLPSKQAAEGALSTELIQSVLDSVEGNSGNEINMILADFSVRRKYLSYLEATRTNVDYLNLDGGFKTLSYNGIPVVADRFAPAGNLYFVNTKDFKLIQLADWQWIEGDNGSILSRQGNTPTYLGTLVKYANLVCKRPMGQAALTGVTA